jgi:hypothetical protein
MNVLLGIIFVFISYEIGNFICNFCGSILLKIYNYFEKEKEDEYDMIGLLQRKYNIDPFSGEENSNEEFETIIESIST